MGSRRLCLLCLNILPDESEGSWAYDGDAKFKSLDAGVAGVWAAKVMMIMMMIMMMMENVMIHCPRWT